MKNIYLLLITLIIISSCQKDEKSIFISKNHFKEFQFEKTQIFDLDTLSFKLIEGKNGTKINFNREDFDISKNDKITLELIELYDFKEILYRNINTVTTKNELLETNGVLYISFKSNEEEINLKKDKVLSVYPPKGKLKNNNVFKTQKTSTEFIKWEMLKEVDTIFPIYKGGGIWMSTFIKKDSIEFYSKLNEKLSKFKNYNSFIKSKYPKYFLLRNSDFGWINIDKIVDVDTTLNFNLIDIRNQFLGFNFYITYKELKSFIYNSRLKNNLKFEEIPISGKTWITVIGEKGGGIFYDKIPLNKKLNNSDIILKMKKTTNKKLQELLIN
ncbi:hypothetical protein [Polaribacter porphyrae]|uniref:Uncharacterized protein n=1 Tax=Polaribacter porphyrae TaxID=1137780 RepID=A0A2S7WRW2_9FLAO|nr:hypothetical protein [Polaribacter porphyrae]PQJ80206.1 hypothetical protein BTO18_13935 [Polaribacter porphyrae]